jgi:hypothetical protein
MSTIANENTTVQFLLSELRNYVAMPTRNKDVVAEVETQVASGVRGAALLWGTVALYASGWIVVGRIRPPLEPIRPFPHFTPLLRATWP